MRDEKGLGGYGIKGLRKSLLMPSPPWTRRTFRYLVPSDLPPPKQGSCSAVGWKIASAKALAECRNVEVVWMGRVMAVVMALVLMVGFEVTGWADEDDDRTEMKDFLGGVYGGRGQYTMAGSIATGEGGVIMKRGSVWLTPRGQYQKVGSVYLTPDGGVVTRAGSTFIDEDEVIVKAGSTYTGNGQTTTTAGSVVLKPRWATR